LLYRLHPKTDRSQILSVKNLHNLTKIYRLQGKSYRLQIHACKSQIFNSPLRYKIV